MKSITKKVLIFIFIVFFFLSVALTFCSCAKEKEQAFDAGQYFLTELTLDGEPLDVSSIYPEGASLLLSSDGTGRIVFGKEACDVPWQGDNGEIRLWINSLEAYGNTGNGSLALQIPDAGLGLVFTEGSIPPAIQVEEEPIVLLTGIQLDAAGDWAGRLWYENPEGEWTDYLNRTLGVSATVVAEPDGKGRICLWNSFYSDIVPIAQINVEFLENEQQIKCCGGWFMSYSVAEWGISISLQEELSSEIEDTIIMHPDVYEYGHYYKSEENVAVDAAAKTEPVLRLKGKNTDGKGSFEYSIVLTHISE